MNLRRFFSQSPTQAAIATPRPAAASADGEIGQGNTERVLVVGCTDLPADLCVSWTQPVANVIDFHSVVVVPPEGMAAEVIPAETYREYWSGFQRLIDTGGTLYVVTTERYTWRPEERSALFMRGNYDWCPLPIRIETERGRSVKDVDPSVRWFMNPVGEWAFTLDHPKAAPDVRQDGTKESSVLYEVNPLAANRAGQALAMRVRSHLIERVAAGYLQVQHADEAWLTSGWAYFLPVHPPWGREQLAAAILGEMLLRRGSLPMPAWLSETMMPPTATLDEAIQEGARRVAVIQDEVAALEAQRNEERRIVGLLYETGDALERLVAAAFSELGVALAEPVGNEEFLGLLDGALAAVEVKGNSKSASGGDYRAAMDHVTQLEVSGIPGARGVLVVCAWRTRPTAERETWFPDNVVRAAQGQGRVSLVRSIDLLEAVLQSRGGDHERARIFMNRVFSDSGLIPPP